jgi:sulfite reductase alpha subunit-like flavoprotein
MIEQDDIEELEEAQEKLQKSEVDEGYIPEILGALVDSDPAISKILTSSDLQVKQKSEPVEIELQESVLETEEGKEAVNHIYENTKATKKALTSTLILVEDKEEVTREEITEFSDYSDGTEISRACSILEDRNILEIDSSGEVNEISLADDWLQNLVKLPELKKQQQDVLDYM